MRATQPQVSAFVERDGFRVHYEVYGDGAPTVFLLMPDTIVHSRAWKAQIPFLARSFRVVVVDPRGNGQSDLPTTPGEVAVTEMIADSWAVLDAVGADQAVLVGLCSGAGQAIVMAAEAPERVLGVCAINAGLGLAPVLPHKLQYDFDAVLPNDDGWAKRNRHYWLRDWPGFCQFFFDEMCPEPHSSKQVEDCVEWATDTTAEVMLLDAAAPADPRWVDDGAVEVCAQVRCPVLAVSGSLDRCQSWERGRRVAELTGGQFVLIDGGGHLPQARDPVKVNLLIRDFVRRVAPRARRPAHV